MIYTLANGCGKSRGNVNACVRPTPRWRTMLLSSGEISSETKLFEGGIVVRGGQSVRMPDIPVDGVFGAFDNLHGFEHGAAFADELRWNARHYYGHAGPAFVKKLVEENPDLHPLFGEVMKRFDPHNDLQRRAARTFAALGLSGELAAHWGIVPWKEGEAIQACVMLFERWQKQMRASGSESPDSKIREVMASYIDKYGDSRFSNVDDSEAKVVERAGYWKDEAVIGDDSQTRRIYMLTSTGVREATRGYDFRHVIAALEAAGALVRKGSDGKTSVNTKTPRRLSGGERLYHIDPDKLS
jgi:putative DNA primase/helicase